MPHTTALGVALADPLAGEAQVEFGLQMAGDVISGYEVLARDGDRFVEAAGIGGAEHGTPLNAG